MNTMKTVEQALAEFVKSGLPDVHELSVHQLERTREIFVAGWKAAEEGREKAQKAHKVEAKS